MKIQGSRQSTPTSLIKTNFFIFTLAICCLTTITPSLVASANENHTSSTSTVNPHTGHLVPGTSFRVFLDPGNNKNSTLDDGLGKAALDTVVKAFSTLVKHRSQYHRFDQALAQNMLQKVVIEPKVLNRDGKEFPFLVARTKQKGKVKLLINASRLEQKGYLNHPEILAPRLAKEFQWVISKASTKPKRKGGLHKRDLRHAPIYSNAEIAKMSPSERTDALQVLLDTYTQTVDAFGSLSNQPYYELGTTAQVKPEQWDSTTKLYDIRVREALQLIVNDPFFLDHTPKAVRSLLNGKVWHVMMAKIDDRDWTTRTRVVPKDKAVRVGVKEKLIQPAKVLINYHRAMESEESLYTETQGLPMGALSAKQLAHVIAEEIQSQITEKSMRGHVAQDEESAP